jgi:GcrA cell cycle regulator
MKVLTMPLDMKEPKGWTSVKVQLLKQLWAEGLSGSAIAARLGGEFSRNAVIGKVHRIGLSGRAQTSRSAVARRARAIRKPPAPVKTAKPQRLLAAILPIRASPKQQHVSPEPFASSEDLAIPLDQRKRLANLEPQDCRWPIGDPQHADFHFCNRSKVVGSFCEFHARKAYLPPTVRRRDQPKAPACVIVKSEKEFA